MDFSTSSTSSSVLEYLVVSERSAPPKPDSLPIRTNSFAAFGLPSGILSRWLPLLDPDHLKALRVPLTEELCSFFLANDNPSLSPFPLLQSADLYIDPEMLPMLPMILSKMPALRSLKIFMCCEDLSQCIRAVEELVAPTACHVPHLEEYHGPHKLLPVVLGRVTEPPPASLRRVFLEAVDEDGDPLDYFLKSFQSCHPLQLTALTHMHFCLLESMDLKLLAKLQDMFPVLQVFHLHASEDSRRSGYVQNLDLTDLYTTPLPSTLESLSVQWVSDRNSAVVADLVAAKDHLVPRLPHLRRLWLFDLSERALLWTRTQAEERCTLHKVGSQDDVWDMDEVVCPESTFFRV